MTTPASLRPATSVDVAKVAGVSRSTVSRILRGDESSFPESTRRRVHEAAASLDYRPSTAGRSLVSGRSDTIVVLLPDAQIGSTLQNAVDEIMQQTSPYGGNVVVRFASASPDATIRAVQALRPLAVLNLGVLDAGDVRRLGRQGTVVVPALDGDQPAVMDPGIAALQLNRLARHGDRPLWYVRTDDGHLDPYSADRFAAIQELCRERGLPEPLQLEVGPTLEDAVAGMQRVLLGGDRAALACYNDDAAIAMVAAARELGVAVPHDVAVIGVDATRAGQLWSPRLTTIAIDMHRFVLEVTAELRAQLGGHGGRAVPDDGAPAPVAVLVPGETA
ncbi:LacI family DNA-binding transcriptional regulator [Curtobacterium sp. BRB10]|uniref:LacI family DNA-binding transcriptional regulator n=1 Tax=Curtobacterium sp. BRB10 TaxID=2962579 RepID=UPI002881417F|nr:LacI family DNA-binding transcriptional regulator [Curtobacterium sp. BRB10]MDT0234842.1 LacI family DNA-binding transcriptional regulator [Curtobacterium sp. BRB10]